MVQLVQQSVASIAKLSEALNALDKNITLYQEGRHAIEEQGLEVRQQRWSFRGSLCAQCLGQQCFMPLLPITKNFRLLCCSQFLSQKRILRDKALHESGVNAMKVRLLAEQKHRAQQSAAQRQKELDALVQEQLKAYREGQLKPTGQKGGRK